MSLKNACFYHVLALALFANGLALGQDGSQMADAADRVQKHGVLLANVLLSLELGESEKAADLLAQTDSELRGTPYRLLDHLLAQKSPELNGTAAPKPEKKYTLAIVHPHAPHLVYLCEGAELLIYDLSNVNVEAPDPKIIQSSRDQLLIYGEFSSDGRRFVAGDVAGGVIVWDTENWSEIAVFTKGEQPNRRVRIDQTGKHVMAETEAGIVLWNVSKNEEIGVVGQRFNFNTAFCFSDDQKHFATGGAGSVMIHDVATGKVLREFRQAPYPSELAFSSDGKYIASGLRGSLNKWLDVFEVATGKVIIGRAEHIKGITGVVFLDQDKTMLATSVDGALKFWHVPSGTQLLSIEMGASIFQPTIGDNGKIVLWNKRGGPRLFMLPNGDLERSTDAIE